jgi:hypothetical protein
VQEKKKKKKNNYKEHKTQLHINTQTTQLKKGRKSKKKKHIVKSVFRTSTKPNHELRKSVGPICSLLTFAFSVKKRMLEGFF